jgi:hypothetical protein
MASSTRTCSQLSQDRFLSMKLDGVSPSDVYDRHVAFIDRVVNVFGREQGARNGAGCGGSNISVIRQIVNSVSLPRLQFVETLAVHRVCKLRVTVRTFLARILLLVRWRRTAIGYAVSRSGNSWA